MRKLLTLAVTLLLASPAWATLLLYDGFEYTSGQLLAPRTDTTATPNPGQLNVAYNVNWRYTGGGAAGQDAPGIGSGSLGPVPGMPAPLGNSVQFDTTQLGASRIEIPGHPHTTTMYWSGFLRVNQVGTLATGAAGMLLGGFNHQTGPGALPTVAGAVLRIRRDTADPADTYRIGTARNTGTGTQLAFDTTPRAIGETMFIVASYEFASPDHIARMWINPNPADFGALTEPAPTLVSSTGGTNPFTLIASFHLRNVNTVGNPNVQFDELRIGTTWASVTPEPGTALLLAGLLASGTRRRRG